MSSFKNDNDFNGFLKKQADKHKMYPSDGVWRAIHEQLHERKSWPALTVLSLLIILALTFSTIIFNAPTKNNVAAPVQNFYIENLAVNNEMQSSKSHDAKSASTVSVVMPFTTVALSHKVAVNKEQENTNSELVNSPVSNQQILVAENAITASNSDNDYTVGVTQNFVQPAVDLVPQVESYKSEVAPASTFTSFQKELTYPIFFNTSRFLQANIKEATTDIFTAKPKFFGKHKPTRFAFQLYATPSISFRRLYDDKTRNYIDPVVVNNNTANAPLAANYVTDVNDIVRHKPALGIEVGAGFLYNVNNRFALKAGLQFNVRKYYIDSYASGLNLASIAVVRGSVLDTINQFTTISATTGYAETKLKSRMYQVSVPIGFEWKLLQHKALGLAVGATVQPTYTLNQNVYLISTDYKFYTDGGQFFRKWNINTAVELNLSYRLGNYNMFIAPQLRYQHLPTYNDNYPIKEYRLDYGLKMGFTKQLFK